MKIFSKFIALICTVLTTDYPGIFYTHGFETWIAKVLHKMQWSQYEIKYIQDSGKLLWFFFLA